jgi:seryl-tRNA synthetase
MIDPKLLRGDLAQVKEKLVKKWFFLDEQLALKLDLQKREGQLILDNMLAERNAYATKIGSAKALGKDITLLLNEVEIINGEIVFLKNNASKCNEIYNNFMLCIPNIPDDSVPYGSDEQNNKIISYWGDKPSFTFTPKEHTEIGELSSQIDFEIASKISGSRFAVMRGGVAKLHRALIQFMLDTHTQMHNYEEVNVPYLVNSAALYGTGQLPKFEKELFKLSGEKDLYLIPTAEVPVTNLIRDKIINEAELPLKFVCHTPCFRSEAGSHGKDTKGLIRQHQFEKVELVQIVKPENSAKALEDITNHAENILQLLQLPYRKILLCGGDLGFSSSKTYDLEVWLPGQNKYREISSCSNMTDFQARRMKARYKNKETSKPEFVHTLNGSGLAIGRTLVAIVENNQTESGKIKIPEVLKKYMNNADFI